MVLLALAWRSFGGATPVSSQRVSNEAPSTAAVVERFEKRASADVSRPRSPLDLQPGPHIESIELDKSEVCFGEENFANVRAHDQSGSSDRLIVTLARSREMGFRLPFRIERGAEARELRVMVSGPGGPPVSMALPRIRVKDCDEASRASIGVALAPRSVHSFVFTARVDAAPLANHAGSFDPVRYSWDFGDGARVTTQEPSVNHSYEGAAQSTRFSYFLISVKVSARDGRVASGSRSYGFPNFGFGAMVDDQRILLMSSGGLDEGDITKPEKVRLYHGYAHPVTIDRVRTKELTRGQSEQVASEEYAGGVLLGLVSIAPGGSATTRDLGALRPTEPGHSREIEVFGHSGKVPAYGKFALTSTTREVDDPALASADSD